MNNRTPIREVKVFPVLSRYVKASLYHPWILTTIFAGVVVTQVAGITASYVLKIIVDKVSTLPAIPASVNTVTDSVFLFGLLIFIVWAGHRMIGFGLSTVEPRVMAILSDSAFSYLIKHSHDFFISNFSGTLTRRVTRYARVYESLLDTTAFTFLPTLLYVIGVIGVLFSRSSLLGLVTLVWTVLFVALQIFLTRWRQPLRTARSLADSEMTGAVSDAISNHQPIAFFAAESHERFLFKEVTTRWKNAMLRSWVADSWIWAIQGLFCVAIEFALVYAAVHYWSIGILTVGDIVLVQIYIIGLIERILNLNNAMRSLYDAFADAYEMVAIFENPHAIQDATLATRLEVPNGEVVFDSVNFGFNEGDGVLHDYSLTIAGGEKIALVGPSGAGKSTITKLLLRLYDPISGQIRIDEQNIRGVTQASLRESIAYVPQEATLFHRSLMENIRYGSLSATDEEVIEASKKAHAHDFISRLPDTYETLVGERGVKLSGGERQRVAIARAILKNAPILVLDEATASLDSENEHLIQEALGVLMQGKTVIVIAHRLSTIMNMDRIIVMERGRIVAEGTHNELLKEGGTYAKLWSIQAGGFIGD